jgi:hypothetical protein
MVEFCPKLRIGESRVSHCRKEISDEFLDELSGFGGGTDQFGWKRSFENHKGPDCPVIFFCRSADGVRIARLRPRVKNGLNEAFRE